MNPESPVVQGVSVMSEPTPSYTGPLQFRFDFDPRCEVCAGAGPRAGADCGCGYWRIGPHKPTPGQLAEFDRGLLAAIDLLAAHRVWLARKDFRSFVDAWVGYGSPNSRRPNQPLARIEWAEVATAITDEWFACSGSELGVLSVACSLASYGSAPLSLRNALSSLDRRNSALVVAAVTHAATGRRPAADL
jgi:hypothetical protein